MATATATAAHTPAWEARAALVARLHAAPVRAAIAVAGGGAQALSWMQMVPGCSRTLYEGAVPYAREAMAAYVAPDTLEHACSADAAYTIAKHAFRRAQKVWGERVLAGDEEEAAASVVGVGCTAALVSDRPKRGEHRVFVSAFTEHGATTFRVTLEKGARDRVGEEHVASDALLTALADACGVDPTLPSWGEEVLERVDTRTHDPIELLLAGVVDTVYARHTPGSHAHELLLNQCPPTPALLLPGSFNPLHDGHTGMMHAVQSMWAQARGLDGAHGTYELCVCNVDKAALAHSDVTQRVARFAERGESVLLTRLPLFKDKLFAVCGIEFVVGADTAVRIVNPKYYGGAAGLHAALGDFAARGVRFWVVGRVGSDGAFCGRAQVDVPAPYEDMFVEVPESAFRLDISSTALRAAAAAAATNTE